ncbi:HEAT repeat domain-containing protein [Cyanobacterium stanieri LEGE 03274]|uniref:HEAT repeat domain-containing protein n=1 Tax=Cyanobacterium stanieri LEGE 03274 TaxID=1828756 RepID=A0ABR9V6P4_9CHRO|nr:HEAT repeat domain-containing protein [Cyanobacterium stanieri]MBE9223548.1 HEAT repeat domain-containing protein [Cyanobacterium stanieri LEGE 03274]
MNDSSLSNTAIDFDNLDPLDAIEDKEPEKPDPDVMLGLLSSDSLQEQMEGVRAFCEISDSRAIPLLIECLSHNCPLIRVSAAYALGRNIDSTTVQPLIFALQNDWNGYVRKGVVWALGNSGDRTSFEPLLHALKHDIAAVRLWSASSIANIAKLNYEDTITAIPSLITTLRQDAIAAVRSNCAWTLGKLCQELPFNVVYNTAIDALIEALVEDEDLGVKEDTKSALLKLGDPRGLQMIEELEFEGLI